MATIDLSSHTSVKTSMFVKITVDGLGLVNFSSHHQSYTIGLDTYTALGSILNITAPSADLTTTNKKVTLTLSGLPQANVDMVQDYEIKGSPIEITRAFFDSQTGALLTLSENPAVRFKGIVTNYAQSENWTTASNTSTNTIQLECANNLGLFRDKRGGRRTNPDDFSADPSFDRIPALVNGNFNFGGVVKK